MKLKIEKFKEFGDVTGSLIPFYLDKHLKNFKIKRFFFYMEMINTLVPTTLIKNVIK